MKKSSSFYIFIFLSIISFTLTADCSKTDYCATCSTEGKCLKCRDEYQFNTSTGKCEKSTLIANCKVYSPDNKCARCMQYYARTQTGTCVLTCNDYSSTSDTSSLPVYGGNRCNALRIADSSQGTQSLRSPIY